MTMRISFGRCSAIGLDVGSRTVKAAQFTRDGRGGHGPRLAACASFPRAGSEAIPTPAELREILSILGRQGFAGRDVVIAASGDKLRSGILELPAKAAGVPMEQIARAEFGRVHKLDVSAAELAWWELPAASRAAKGTLVMAVAYPHADAEPHLSAFEEAGFRVRAVDTPTSALARGCLPLVEGKRSFGALELGASAAVLALVRDGVVAYERRIPDAGIERLLVTLEARLGAGREAAEHVLREVGLAQSEPAGADRFAAARESIARHVDAAVAEVRRTLAYASHQYAGAAVEALLLCGGGASVPGLREYVASSVETAVQIARFDPALPCDEDVRRRLGAHLACAIGLARFS
jgi:type IV pilus assembly protein PilM